MIDPINQDLNSIATPLNNESQDFTNEKLAIEN